MVESPIKVVIISDDDELETKVSNIDMECEIETKNFGLDEDHIVYTGAKLFYEEFSKKLVEKGVSEDLLVKKGSEEAPGMYSLGSLDTNNYRDV